MARGADFDRRNFLKLAGGTAAVAAGATLLPSTAALARPPIRVTRSGRRVPPGKVSVQMFTLRSVTNSNTVAGVFDTLSDLGYRSVELAGYYGYSAAQLRQLADNAGLRVDSSHDSYNAVTGNNLSQVIENALTLGQKYIVIPSNPNNLRNPDGYRQQAEAFNRAGEQIAAAGLELGYHNHNWEFATLANGEVGYDILLQNTDPRYVSYQLDIYWAVVANRDPVSLFHQYPRRFSSYHVKDQAPGGGFANVGQGVIDFGRIFQHDNVSGARLYIVENDQPGSDPLGAVAISADYLINELRY
jgi:sugar phosphate isomerase/epimerase